MVSLRYFTSAALLCTKITFCQKQNPLELNGGSCIAMRGKGCVAIASDKRFGKQYELVSNDAKRILKLHGRLLCAFTGLTTDVQTLMQELSSAISSYGIIENQPIEPLAAATLLSRILYSKRKSPYFCETIIAGLDRNGSPVLKSHDILGASGSDDGFAVSGTSANSLYGLCEAYYRPDMNPEELSDVIEQCLLSALERDCLSGYGAVIHLLTQDGIYSRELESPAENIYDFPK